MQSIIKISKETRLSIRKQYDASMNLTTKQSNILISSHRFALIVFGAGFTICLYEVVRGFSDWSLNEKIFSLLAISFLGFLLFRLVTRVKDHQIR